MDGRVETAIGALACGEGELGELEELRPDVEGARRVEPRELRSGEEAREEALEPPELLLSPRERGVAVRVEQELHLRPHRPERAVKHQDVLVVVRGGSVTTRTVCGAFRRAAPTCARSAAS